MDIRMTKFIICPTCRNELWWEIKEKNNNRIINGYAKCMECREIYPIKNGIAIFLPIKWQNMKIWRRSERVAVQKMEMGEEHETLKNENIRQPSEILNMIRYRNRQGIIRNEALYHQYMESIGMPDTVSKLCYLARRCAKEVNDVDYILDFASGKCLLVNELSKLKNCHVIVNDINPIVVMQAQQNFEKFEHMSFMAFDMKRSPFRNKSIHTVTTMLGLQNIIPCNGIIEEINRIADVFINISAYLSEGLLENIEILNKYHMRNVWIKEQFDIIVEQFSWKSQEICSIMDLAKGISREEIETRFAVMKFPVKEEVVKYALTKYLIS